MKVTYNITQNKFNVKFQTGYYPLPGGGGGGDTSNLVPYTGANKDVNIGAYFFESSQGFKITGGTTTQALTAVGGIYNLNTKADLVSGKVPASQLPAYIDDVLEFANLASFPATGENGKIYIAIDTNLTYRWGGSSYVLMSSSLALGETSSTAYRGDRGKIAYDHSQATGNPHNTTKADIGLGNVPNIDATNPTNIVQTSSYRFVTDNEKTNLTTAYNHSQATGNPHGTKLSQLSEVNTATLKATPVDADNLLLQDSVDSNIWKKLSWSNVKSTLKTYFDGIYTTTSAVETQITTAVVNETKKATITVELISQLTTNFYAPNALRINYTALISGSGTLTLKVNDVAYTLGNLIPQGAKITAETTSSSVFNLISIYE